MKIKWVLACILWTFTFIALNNPTALGQLQSPSITVLYSNNINGEIDPCPV
jgi:hypothetical protein